MQPCAKASAAAVVTNAAARAATARVLICMARILWMSAPAFHTAKELRAAGPENSGADAHDRRPLLDCHIEIAAHPHRQFPEHFWRDSGFQPPAAQFAQLPEPRAGLLGVIGDGREGHQA